MIRFLLLLMLSCNAVYAKEDCVFDQNAFNEGWIKSRPGLKPYVWNEDARAFEVTLSEDELLRISGGGCVHYGEIYQLSIPGDGGEERSSEFYKTVLLRLANLVFDKGMVGKAEKEIGALNIPVAELQSGKPFIVYALPYERFGFKIQETDSKIDVEINWYQN